MFYSYVKKFSLGANQRIDDQLQLHADADFLLYRVYGVYEKPFKIMISDTTSNYNWFSSRIRSENWFGTPQYPNELSKPIELVKNTLLKFDVENLSDTANDIEIVFEGIKLYDKKIELTKDKYFCYVLDVDIKPLDIKTEFLRTNADSDFVAYKLYAYKDEDYNLSLRMSTTSSGGRFFSSEYINIENMFGSLLRPNILKAPITLAKNTIIQLDLKNNINNNQYAQFVFDGIKKF